MSLDTMVGSIRTMPTYGMSAIGNSFVDINLEWAVNDQVDVINRGGKSHPHSSCAGRVTKDKYPVTFHMWCAYKCCDGQRPLIRSFLQRKIRKNATTKKNVSQMPLGRDLSASRLRTAASP